MRKVFMIKRVFLVVFTFFSFQVGTSEKHLSSKDFIKTILSEMVEADQLLRKKIDFSKLDDFLKHDIQNTDKENTETLKEILTMYHWITISDFGEEADHNAWLLLQHADHDVGFQKEILGRLEKLYPLHETSSQNFAYLYDRVAKNDKRPQRYGTQGTIENGTWVVDEIEDVENLDLRREKMGMVSHQDYVHQVNRVYNLTKE